jgi:site-specific recombinase XerC
VRVAAVDFDLDVVVVLGKGCRDRAVPFGRKTQGRSTATRAPGPA